MSAPLKLRNIGPKSAAWLRQVGLRTPEDLAAAGPVEAFMRVKRAGFKPGAVGNAPAGITVKRAVVYTTKSDDPAAELVAKTLGKATQVVHSDEEMGPGVDVVIGDRFKRLDPKAPAKIALPKPEVTCQ